MRKLAVIVVGVCLAGASFGQGVSDVRIRAKNQKLWATVTNGTIYTQMADASGNLANIDSESSALRVVDNVHADIHSGRGFTLGHLFENQAQNVTNYLRVVNQSASELHASWEITAESQGIVRVYTNSTYGGDGTALRIFNDVWANTTTSAVTAFHTPTAVTNGVIAWPNCMVAGGTIGQTDGGNQQVANFHIPVNTDLLISITQEATGNKDRCIRFRYTIDE